MKKGMFLLLILGLCGCAATNNVMYTKNPRCTNVKEMRVFQVVKGGALATISGREPIVAYLPNSDRYALYDGAKIKRSQNECIVYDGVYKYMTSGDNSSVTKYMVSGKETNRVEYSANEKQKTVPIVKFEKRWLDME